MNTCGTTITVERDDIEIEVECLFNFYPACRGQRDSCGGVRGAGPPLEPDEPETLEFESASAGGKEFYLTKNEMDRAEQKLWETRNNE